MYGRRTFLRRTGRMMWGGAIALSVPRLLHAKTRGGPAYLERCVAAMGTTVSISAYGSSRDVLVRATSGAFAELYRMDRLLSVFRPESDISRLNETSGIREQSIDETTSAILLETRRFHALTKGGFDATVEPLMRAWGFRSEGATTRQIEPDELASIRESMGMQHVHVADGSAYIDAERTKVDLGGIAVGFTVDRIADILRHEGVEAALINHGGDIFALGAPPETTGWEIVIEDPGDDGRPGVAVRLKDAAISTSSNVRSFRRVDGVMIGHILDPRTGGNPRGIVQLSVIAPLALSTDAISTGLFMAREEAALRSDAAHLRRSMPGDEIRMFGYFAGRAEGIWV